MKAKNILRLVLALLVLVAVLTAWQTGLYEKLSVESVRRWLLDAGPWGGVLFVLAVSVLQPMHLSMHAFILAASQVWPPLEAMLYCFLGLMGAALSSFGFARFMAAEWVQARIPDKLKPYEARLEDKTFTTVLILRLLFFTTPMVQFSYGVLKLRFWPWMAAMALGSLPYVVIEVLLGSQLQAWLAAQGWITL